MNKADIVRHIQKTAGIEEDQAASLLEQVLGLLKTTLKTGEPIQIIGFGKFFVREKKAREGRNPDS